MKSWIRLADRQSSWLLNPGKGELSSRQQHVQLRQSFKVLRHRFSPVCCRMVWAELSVGQTANLGKKAMLRMDAAVHSGVGKHHYQQEGSSPKALQEPCLAGARAMPFLQTSPRNREIKFGSLRTQQAVGNLSHGSLCGSSTYH